MLEAVCQVVSCVPFESHPGALFCPLFSNHRSGHRSFEDDSCSEPSDPDSAFQLFPSYNFQAGLFTGNRCLGSFANVRLQVAKPQSSGCCCVYVGNKHPKGSQFSGAMCESPSCLTSTSDFCSLRSVASLGILLAQSSELLAQILRFRLALLGLLGVPGVSFCFGSWVERR